MKITLDIGEKKQVSIAGGQFYLLNSVGKILVKIVSTPDGREFELSAGMGFRIRDGERFFKVEVANISGYAQTIEFEISDREVFDNRTVGIVEVVNSDKNRTDFDGAYMLAGGQPGTPGAYRCLALRNPTGSGKNIYVNRASMSVQADSDCLILVTPTIDADQVLSGVTLLALGINPAISKRIAVGAAGGAGRFDSFASDALPKGNMRAVARTFVGANQSFVYGFTEPFKLVPGSAIVIANWVVNQSISATFETFEEVIS